MRSLTFLPNQTQFQAAVQLQILAADASTTYVHCLDSLALGSLPRLRWEAEFMGGLAKQQSYPITLAMCLDTIKARLPKLVKGTATLQVDIGGNRFYPHVGVVRGPSRMTPDDLTLTVVDKGQDTDPLIPQALVDSWSALPVEHLTDGMPLYYGKHTRPLFMTAVQSDLSVLLGPRNVSSANHVTSLWFASNLRNGSDVTLKETWLTGHIWQQQSGAANVASSARPLSVIDVSTGQTRLYEPAPGSWHDGQTAANSHGFLTSLNGSTISGLTAQDSGLSAYDVFWAVRTNVPQSLVKRTYSAWGTFAYSCSAPFTANSHCEMLLGTYASSGSAIGGLTGYYAYTSSIAKPFVVTFSMHVDSAAALPVAPDLFTGSVATPQVWMRISPLDTPRAGGSPGEARATLMFMLELRAQAYRRYSVFGPQVASADVAISANPFAIVDDVLSHATGTPYRQDQSSAAQALVQSYQFNGMYLGPERRALTDFLDEVGQVTGTMLWFGDCGMLNYRPYPSSGAATVDFTVTESVMAEGSFRLTEGPVGSALYEGTQVSKLTLRSAYNFQTGIYEQVNLGVNCLQTVAKEKQVDTRLIDGSVEGLFTASLYLNNLMRKYATPVELVECDLPPTFLGVELGDVMRVQHRMLIGSEALYMVKAVELDLAAMQVHVVGCKLVP